MLRDEFGTYASKMPPTAPESPPESLLEGCPGAWYVSPFSLSVQRYLRQQDANGGRVVNLLLADAPPLVLLAVTYYELEASRHDAHWGAIEAQLAEDEEKRRRASKGKGR